MQSGLNLKTWFSGLGAADRGHLEFGGEPPEHDPESPERDDPERCSHPLFVTLALRKR
jgi:hypothetical protein